MSSLGTTRQIMRITALNESLVLCEWNNCGKLFKFATDCHNHCCRDHISLGITQCQWRDCHIVSTTSFNLTSHLIVHIPVINGSCHICEKNFRRRGDYVKHLKLHSETENRFNAMVEILFSK